MNSKAAQITENGTEIVRLFAETLFGILLIAGFKIRMASVPSGLLLLSFGD